MLANVIRIFRIGTHVELEHAFAEAALQRGLLVSAEVEAALLCQFLQQVLQRHVFAHGCTCLPSQRSFRTSAMPAMVTTKSTQPVEIAACGIVLKSALPGSWASVVPPAS